MTGKRRTTQERIAEIMERAQRRADRKTIQRERQKQKRPEKPKLEKPNKQLQKQKERQEIERLKAEYAERLLNKARDNKEPILRR